MFFTFLQEAIGEDWRSYVEHPFVGAIGNGSLPTEAYRHYVVQDYLFLAELTRVHALGVFKAPTVADMRRGTAEILLVEREMLQVIASCHEWDLTETDLEAAEPGPATCAYVRFLHDLADRGDALSFAVGLAPCTIGYVEIGARLAAQAGERLSSHRYRDWIAAYAAPELRAFAWRAEHRLEDLAERYLTPVREQELIATFREATRLEAAFWDAALGATV